MYSKGTILEKESMFDVSQQLGLDYVLKLDPDRLLSPCYTAMGKIPKAGTYGGWESRQIQGHSLGHYLSALSGFISTTGNQDARNKLDYTISCIKDLQRGDGYFGGIPSTPFEKAFSGTFNVDRFGLGDWWVPWYSVHKIYAGLIDAYVLCDNKDALEIVLKMADWAINGSKNMTEEQFQKMLFCEHGGMLKVYADLYEITKEEKYLLMAERFIHQEIYKPLVKERDRLQGYHANTQIPKIIGLAKLYDLTGKSEYRTAAEYFYNTVLDTRSYSIGGNSIGEHFGPQFEEKLGRDTCETCNTYNMLELSEYIFRWNKNSKVSDFYETALYNHILASQDPQTGAKTYFVSMLPGFFKIYCSLDNSFWCCTGTGFENPARYNRFIFSEFEDTIYVNLFIPSTYTSEDGWKIQIETKFPYEEKFKVKVLQEGKNPKNIKVRIPSWIEREDLANSDDGYTKLEKLNLNWGKEYSVPMKISIKRTKDRSGNFSILYGPLVLAAQLKEKVPVDIVGDHLIYMNFPAARVSPIIADISNPESWISIENKEKLEFRISESATEDKVSYLLKPFYDIHHVRYSTYFNAENPKEDARTLKYENITLDYIEPGRQQSEIEHGYKSSGTESGYINDVDRSFRFINEKEGFISYRIKLDGTVKNKLVITTYGKDKGELKIYLGDDLLKNITIDGTKGKELIDYEIEIPSDLIGDKNKTKKRVTKTIKLVSDKNESLKVLEIRACKDE